MTFTEQEVVEIVEVPAKRLRSWIRRGWIRPEARGGAPVFAEVDVARIRLVCQLRDELGIEGDSVGVVLSLLDQVHGLRRELKALARAIESQPEAVRIEVMRVRQSLMDEPEG